MTPSPDEKVSKELAYRILAQFKPAVMEPHKPTFDERLTAKDRKFLHGLKIEA